MSTTFSATASSTTKWTFRSNGSSDETFLDSRRNQDVVLVANRTLVGFIVIDCRCDSEREEDCSCVEIIVEWDFDYCDNPPDDLQVIPELLYEEGMISMSLYDPVSDWLTGKFGFLVKDWRIVARD